jgi:alpha-galactosidase/6-phospho-beta-glucosidase family protein
MRNKLPKIVIVGAGSLFFGRQAIWAANHLPGLKGCTLSLVDTDPQHLDKMVRLAKLAAETSGSGTVVEGFVDYRQALPGADFVVLSFSERNAHYRRIDCRVAARYGVRMCSGDTIGAGGVFRTLREFPKILEICHAIEKICPDAWVINYVNPSAIMGIGVMRHSKVKSFALCDSHHMPGKKESYLKLLGEDLNKMDRFDMRIAGVNHFTWMLKAELDGEDVLPRIREAFRALSIKERDQGHSKGRFNNFITAQLADLLGAIPTCTGHTKEYVPYYQGRAAIQEPIPPLAIFDSDEREEVTAKFWQDVDDYISGIKPMSEFHAKTKSDHATDIIHTMVVEDGRTYFINRSNSDCAEGAGRAVGNLPDDAFLEMECRLDRKGPRPLPVGDFPLGLRAQQFLILDVHELTIQAIMQRDRSLLVRALAMDPLVNSIATADVLIDELYEAEKEALPDWVKMTASTDVAASLSKSLEMSERLVPQLY